MVVTVTGFLIDATLYQIARPAWPELAGMMAIKMHGRPWRRSWWELELMASAEMNGLMIGWFDNPRNTTWQGGPDALDPARRMPVVTALIEKFGAWKD